MVKKVELKEGEDFYNLKELIKLICLGIKVIECNGILNIFRHIGHDRDMSLAQEERDEHIGDIAVDEHDANRI